MGILSMDFLGWASQMMLQVHIVPKDATMTILNATGAFLRDFDFTWILIPGIMGEILKFREACEWWKATLGGGSSVQRPFAIPKVFSAVWHCASDGEFWAGRSITGRLTGQASWSIPKEASRGWKHILHSRADPGITGDGLEHGSRKPSGNHKLHLFFHGWGLKKEKGKRKRNNNKVILPSDTISHSEYNQKHANPFFPQKTMCVFGWCSFFSFDVLSLKYHNIKLVIINILH